MTLSFLFLLFSLFSSKKPSVQAGGFLRRFPLFLPRWGFVRMQAPGQTWGRIVAVFSGFRHSFAKPHSKSRGILCSNPKNKPLSFWISSLPGAKDVAVFWQADKQFSPLAEFIIDEKGSPPIRKGCPFLRPFLQQRLHLLDHPLFQINQPISYLSGRSVRLGILVEVFV